MPNSLFPGFIKVEYHSLFAPHVMVLPVNTPTINEGNPEASTINTWLGGEIDWTDMVEELVTEMADSMPTNAAFDVATLYSMETPTSVPLPRSQTTLAIAGTVAPASTNKATQLTIVARDTEFAIAKLVLLDFESSDDFARYTTPAGRTLTGLWAAWILNTNGWASRNGARPATFLQSTATLNEKLRRAYRLT